MADTPTEMLQDINDKRATSGVPIAAIALACTLVRIAGVSTFEWSLTNRYRFCTLFSLSGRATLLVGHRNQ